MIHLMRHGRTVPSDAYLVSGPRSRGTPLSSAGRDEVAAATAVPPAQLIVHSDYVRTKEVAATLPLPPEVPMRTDSRLDELDYGDFDGGPWLEYGRWLDAAGLTAVPPGGAESWAGCFARSLSALSDLATTEIPTLVIGHGYQWSALEHYMRTETVPHPLELGPAPHVTVLHVCTDILAKLSREWAELTGDGVEELMARWSADRPMEGQSLSSMVDSLRRRGLRLGVDHAQFRPAVYISTREGHRVGRLDENGFDFAPLADDPPIGEPLVLRQYGGQSRLPWNDPNNIANVLATVANRFEAPSEYAEVDHPAETTATEELQ